jgi:hypothetical protein
VAADWGGDIGPFQLAIALTVIVTVPICFWRENYGHSDSDADIAQDITLSTVSTGEKGTGKGAVKGKGKGKKGGGTGTGTGTETDTTNGAITTDKDSAADSTDSAGSGSGSGRESISMLGSLRASCRIIMQQPSVLCLGLSQAFFEGAVYTFGE